MQVAPRVPRHPGRDGRAPCDSGRADSLLVRFDVAFWESPELTSIGRLPMTSPRDRGECSVCLDGKWRFALAPSPIEVPEGFASREFDDYGWTMIDVPGVWTMQGVGDRPIYTN